MNDNMDNNYELTGSTGDSELEQRMDSVMSMSTSGDVAAAMSAVQADSDTDRDDPKEYVETPFRYTKDENESISLNSGALSYSANDLALPGKNGFDLVITRQYNSSAANIRDANIEYGNATVNEYYFQYELWEKSTYQDYRVGTYDVGGFATAGDRDAAMNRLKDQYPMDYWDSTGVKWTEYVKNFKNGVRGVKSYNTGTRLNAHFVKLYGLGQGWSFNFPSIETVPDYDRRQNVVYFDYLHVGDGRSYKIGGNAGSGLLNSDDTVYSLLDIRIQKNSSTGEYTLSFKDGKTARFRSDKTLSYIQDRFGNTISFAFGTDGRLASITDTMNRVFDLVKEPNGVNYALRWKRRDTG